MIQKATWIIPGILVTLLLGLLWAMPAFAAEAGTIEFKVSSAAKADEISYVSLNGPAGVLPDGDGKGIWIQVTDQDLNAPSTKYFTGGTAPPDVDWSDLADANDDGTVNYKDFSAFDDGVDGNGKRDSDEPVIEVDRADVAGLNTQTGELTSVRLPTGATHIEYMIDEQLTIGAFVRSHKEDDARTSGTGVQDDDDNVIAVDYVAPEADDTNLQRQDNASPTWADVLADPDGDGNLAEHIKATITVMYDTATDAVPPVLDADGGTATIELDVEVVEVDDVPMTVRVSIADVTHNPDDDVEEGDDATTLVTTALPVVLTVNSAITLTYPTVYVGMGSLDQIGLVTVASDGNDGAVGVALKETGSSTGKFGSSLMICESDTAEDSACKADQVLSVDTDDRPGMIKLPVNAAGDTIRVAYKDGSPSSTRRAEISLDVNPPTLSNLSPESGTAGSDDEPELFFDVVDAESGISAFDKKKKTPKDSIQAVVALYERGENDAFSKVVTFLRDDLSDDDEITDGFSASFEVNEGGEGRLDLDNANNNQYEIRWWAVAMDKAGNTGVSDQKDATPLTGTMTVAENSKTVTGNKTKFKTELKVDEYIEISGQVGQVARITTDTALTLVENFDEGVSAASATTGTCYPQEFEFNLDNIAGCDPHVIQVDTQSPTMTEAITGNVLGDDNKPKADNSLTSIQVTFDEALNCDTVSADDFEVDGDVPNAASCYKDSVYLSVDEMDRDDKPEVELVGAVMDSAGNVLDSDDDEDSRTQDAKDGIGASITATVTGTTVGADDRPITDKQITVSITSDERLAGSPKVEIRKVGKDYSLVSEISGTAVPTGTTNEWTFERNFTTAGLYNVYVYGGNVRGLAKSYEGLEGENDDPKTDKAPDVRGAHGFSLSKDELKDDDVILFEVDTGVAAPKFDPGDDEETDNPNVFIRIDFASEGKEYGLKVPECKDLVGTPGAADADDKTFGADKPLEKDGTCAGDKYTKTVTGDPATTADMVDVDFDTSGTVEVTKATFDGEDVLESVNTRNSVLYIFNPGNLTLGDHKLVIEATDKAGNESKAKGFTVEFTVTERKPYKLVISPGPNLVSFPANPVDGDINAVFGGEGNEKITRVLSIDNASGLWMAATKGEDGMFMGDLTSVNGMNGYWVVSDGFVDVSVVLQGGGNFTSTPPHIAVQKGWNLIGVVDAQQRKAGAGIATSEYFANIDAQVVYGFDSVAGRLVRLSTATLTAAQVAADEEQDMVETGKAYWVYANEAGIIIP